MFVILVTMERVVVNVGDITHYQNFILPSVFVFTNAFPVVTASDACLPWFVY